MQSRRIEMWACSLAVLLAFAAKSDAAAPTPDRESQAPSLLATKEEMIRDRFVRFQDRVFRLQEQLSDKEPQNAERLARTLQRAGELGLADNLDQIVAMLNDASRVADASDAQQRWVDDANRLLAILLERDSDNQDRRNDIQRLQEYKKELEQILGQQKSLRDETGQAGAAELMRRQIEQALERIDAASRKQESIAGATKEAKDGDAATEKGIEQEQTALSRETEQIAADLARLGAQPDEKSSEHSLEHARTHVQSAAEAAKKSGSAMGEASQALKQGAPSQAGAPQQSAAEALQQARKELEAAKQELEKESQRADLPQGQRKNAEQTRNLSNQMREGANSPSSQQQGAGQSKGKQGEKGAESKPSQGGQQSQSGGQKHSHSDPKDKKQCSRCKRAPGLDQVDDAENQMDDAAESLEKEKPDEAAPKQDDAIDSLEQALNEIEESLQQLRTEEREEVLRDLEDRFRDMLGRQRVINEGTVGLHGRLGDNPPERAEQLELSDLTAQQRSLQKKAAGCVHILDEEGTTIAFPRVVGQISEDMGSVADLLASNRVGPLTQQVESDVVDALEQLLDAVKKMQRENQKQASSSCSGGGGGNKPLLPPSAELKLLRSSQLRVNQRTVVLQDAVNGAEPADVVTAGLQAAAARQTECAEIARQMRDRKAQP